MASDTLPLDFGNDKPPPFYVYLYRDPRLGRGNEPLYVGKGSTKPGKRWQRSDYHWLFGYQTNGFFKAVLEKIRTDWLKPPIEIVAYFDSETDALALEVELIAKIGRRDLNRGTLLNLTDGGDGVSGYVPPPEVVEKHRINGALTWANATPELRKAMSKTRDLWQDIDHRAIRVENCVKGRAVRWEDLTVKAADCENIRQAKLADRETISAKQKAHKKTPEHIKNAGDRRREQAADGTISTTSKATWAREGQREKQGKAIGAGQKSSWNDPVKGALRRERLAATYARKRAEKAADEATKVAA